MASLRRSVYALTIVLTLFLWVMVDYSCSKSQTTSTYKDQFSTLTGLNIIKDPNEGEDDFFGFRPLVDPTGLIETDPSEITLLITENIITPEPSTTFNCKDYAKIDLLKRLGLNANAQVTQSADNFTQGVIIYGGIDPERFPVIGLGLKIVEDELPAALFCFKDELRYLVMRSAPFSQALEKQADLFKNFALLERLDLAGAHLKAFPSVINELHSLKNLNLSGSNVTDHMKIENLGALQLGLEKLFINHAGVRQMSGFNCSRLKVLHARENSLYNEVGLNSILGACLVLEELDLFGNSLDANQLTQLTLAISHSVQRVDLSNNNSKGNAEYILPAHWDAVHVLGLANTSLKGLPSSIYNYRNLERLDVSANSFINRRIEAGIGNLTRLVELRLQNSGVNYVDPAICTLNVRVYVTKTEFDQIKSDAFWNSPAAKDCRAQFQVTTK